LEVLKKGFFGEQRGLTITANPGYVGRAIIPQDYSKFFDRLLFTVPDLDIINQLKLW